MGATRLTPSVTATLTSPRTAPAAWDMPKKVSRFPAEIWAAATGSRHLSETEEPAGARRWLAPVARLAPPTGASHLVIHILFLQPQDALTAPWIAHFDVGQAVLAIQERFSISIGELARVLRVSRPTIYAWLEGGARLKPENRARLARLRNIALSWDSHSRLPLRDFVQEAPPGMPSLLDLLSAGSLDEAAIHAAFQRLAPLVQAREAARPPSIREIFARHGIAPEPVPDHVFRQLVAHYSHLGK